MKSKTHKGTFREWFSAEELHEESKKWCSELKFAKDEQKFLDSMIKDYTLDILDSDMFNTVQPVVESLKNSESELIKIFKKVQLHESQLQIMVDDVDQGKMENAYLDTHSELAKEMASYFVKYRDAKAKIFSIVSKVIRRKKQKKLLN